MDKGFWKALKVHRRTEYDRVHTKVTQQRTLRDNREMEKKRKKDEIMQKRLQAEQSKNKHVDVDVQNRLKVKWHSKWPTVLPCLYWPPDGHCANVWPCVCAPCVSGVCCVAVFTEMFLLFVSG